MYVLGAPETSVSPGWKWSSTEQTEWMQTLTGQESGHQVRLAEGQAPRVPDMGSNSMCRGAGVGPSTPTGLL